jgi:7-cyano-7-deazaguanine synthase in queuosine biosynthesis
VSVKVNRILIPFSGGIDSTACACMARRTHKEAHIKLAHVLMHNDRDEPGRDYGEPQMERAEVVAKKLGMPFEVIGEVNTHGCPVANQSLWVPWMVAVATQHRYEQIWWGFNYYNEDGFDINYRWDELGLLMKQIHHWDGMHVMPVLHMTRREELRTIPRELWSDLVTCNFIRDGKACGRCGKCQAFTKAIQGQQLAEARMKRHAVEEKKAEITAQVLQLTTPTQERA